MTRVDGEGFRVFRIRLALDVFPLPFALARFPAEAQETAASLEWLRWCSEPTRQQKFGTEIRNLITMCLGVLMDAIALRQIR